MIVVELNEHQIVVRANGRNQTLQRDNLPLAMEVALAERWFDKGRPSTKVFRGSMMAVTPDFDVDEARELWRQAKREGAELNGIEKVLDDDYDLAETIP